MGKVLSANRQFCYLSIRNKLVIHHATPRICGTETPPVSGNRAAASSSSDSVLERSDELATRKHGQESLTSDKKDVTDNLKPTDVHAPAHISQDSDSENSAKVATKSRMHSIFTHFPKDRKCDVCLRTKYTKASCRRRICEALPRALEFVNVITADHKALNEGCESRDIHWYAVMVQDLATQRIQSYPCKTKSLHETEKPCSNSCNRRKHRKLKIQTTQRNLGQHVRCYH